MGIQGISVDEISVKGFGISSDPAPVILNVERPNPADAIRDSEEPLRTLEVPVSAYEIAVDFNRGVFETELVLTEAGWIHEVVCGMPYMEPNRLADDWRAKIHENRLLHVPYAHEIPQ